ncbi:uncharacterized protein LOC143604916 [Bidens hawaiensis]|uniref:uncharacterized protein LOC143604916 n=1 Tax=Bidens hawaiensis TaxID=980011 RepID=UPI00404B8D57
MADNANNAGNVPVRENNNTSFQVPKLTTTNYNTWTILMESVLDAQGLWETIKPVTGGAVDEKKNKIARAILYQALPEDILLQVARNRSAKDIWEALRVRFLGADRVQTFSKYTSLGSNLEDEVLVRKLLNSVPKKYLQIVASIEQYSDLDTMPFEEAIGRLKAYEERIREQDETGDNDQSKLLLTKTDGQESSKNEEDVCECCGRGKSDHGRGRGRGRGVGRGRGGRFQPSENQKEKGKGRGKAHIRCYNCLDYGHFAYECPGPKRKEEATNLVREDLDPTLF